MNRGTQIILSLTTRELRGALVRNGEIIQAESFRLDDSVSWSEAWDDGLRPFDQALRQFVSRVCKKSTRRTMLVYQSPSAVVQFDAIEGTKQEAMALAKTRIHESVGLSGCVQTKVLEHGSKDPANGLNSCLTIGDQDSTTRKLYAWMIRCGLKPDRMVPIGGVMISHAIESSMQQPAETAVCYMGEESSVISFVVDGQVKLLRSIEIGYRHLNDAYYGAFGSKDSDEGQRPEVAKFLAGSDASEMIWKYGVPIQASDDWDQTLRREVLSRIAPILQRYSVEIKQTFRFGLANGEAPSRLVLHGPGASIPHIAAALSQNCDLHIDLVCGAEMYTPTKSFGSGTLEGRLAESGGSYPNILPKVAVESNKRRSYDRAIAAGIALALGFMAIDLGSVQMQRAALLDEIQNDASRVQAIENEEQIRTETIAHAGAVGQIATVFTESYGLRPQWSVAFEGVSAAMEKSIHIEQVHGDNTGGDPTVGLTGLAVGNKEVTSTEMLNAFVAKLREQPGVLDVRLGATAKRATPDGKPAVHFELTMPIRTTEAPFYEYTSLASGNSEKGNP